MRNKHLLTILILAVAVVLTGCDRNKVYSHYEHVPQGGWDKTDTLFFEVPPVTDLDYPFQSLALVVAQEIHPKGEFFQTIKNCSLYDESGKERGNGISRFQNVIYLSDIQLEKGDSLRVCITHNMRQEMMQGLSDIGFILTRK